MAIVKNVDPKNRPVVLTTGLLLAPGEEENVDPEATLEAALIARKILKVIDPDVEPPAEEDPYASRTAPFYVHEQQPIGMPIGALWLDTSTGELNRLVPED